MSKKIINYDKLIIDEFKHNKITMEEALKYKKIASLLYKYDNYDELEYIESEYYIKYGCTSEIDKIKLELRYLKKKLLDIYLNEEEYSKRRRDISLAIIKLDNYNYMLNEKIEDNNLLNIKNDILEYELKFDIEFKFLTEAYDMLCNNLTLKEKVKK